MQPHNLPRLVPGKHILPSDGIIPAHEDILVYAAALRVERRGAPLALAHVAQLEVAPDRLRLAKVAPQQLVPQRLLRRLPLLEPRLERVRRVDDGDGRGRVARVRNGAAVSRDGDWADTVAEHVVESRRRGGRRRGRHVAVHVGAGWFGHKAERLDVGLVGDFRTV